MKKENQKVMRKGIWWLLILSLLFLPACTSRQEETKKEAEKTISMPGEINFSFPEEWLLHEEENTLLAKNTLTGSSISITCEDLTKKEGGTLIRMEDYLEAIQENLKTSKDYSYRCGPVEMMELYGKQYYSFMAEVPELSGTQHFYIRRIDDRIMVMMITLFGEDTLEGIFGYGKALE